MQQQNLSRLGELTYKNGYVVRQAIVARWIRASVTCSRPHDFVRYSRQFLSRVLPGHSLGDCKLIRGWGKLRNEAGATVVKLYHRFYRLRNRDWKRCVSREWSVLRAKCICLTPGFQV